MVRRVLVALVVGAGVIAALPAVASAGQWMQISCVNPDGSRASNYGWTSGRSAALVNGRSAVECGPGAPMDEYLSPGAQTAAPTQVSLNYAPPSGSRLIGGQLAIVGYDGGYGSGAAISVSVDTSEPGGTVLSCSGAAPAGPCADDYFGTTVTLPAGQDGGLHLVVACTGTGSCQQGAFADGDDGQLDLKWAHLLLSNASVPKVQKLGGTVTTPDVGGHPRLRFTASDPDGPGVYRVFASIDGHTVYSRTPRPLGGDCVPVGRDASSGALEFDVAQPCPRSVDLDVPVDTRALTNGDHELTITVTDAAGNKTTVHRRVSTDNPTSRPLL